MTDNSVNRAMTAIRGLDEIQELKAAGDNDGAAAVANDLLINALDSVIESGDDPHRRQVAQRCKDRLRAGKFDAALMAELLPLLIAEARFDDPEFDDLPLKRPPYPGKADGR